MGDEAEVAKAIVQGAVEGVITPFVPLLERLFGVGAHEAGLILGDVVGGLGASIRSRMQIRKARFLAQTQRMLEEMHAEPQQVPLKILIPIIQNATLEEDDDLQDRWAALLANNAARKYEHTTFPELLRQLSHDDAKLLRECLYSVLSPPAYDPNWQKQLDSVIDRWNLAREYKGLNLSCDNLVRLGILERDAVTVNSKPPRHKFHYLGYIFSLACEDPANLPKF